IDFVDNTVDPGTGTIAVWALFDNPDGILLPGQYVSVLVARSQPELMTVVPQSAVLEDHDGRYVLVVNDKNQVAVRRIETGPVVGTNWSIKSGLTVNEKVIIEGVQKVRPGQLVKTALANEQKGG
ncbi:MAG: efflux RND transporter periplasmic adaptor subunit, partial [Deltaproteobacteria bacterium]|nr:efflux RND transporter periplasmic adaptor subunit [Deltaproteobacteria bacterium]